MASKSVIKLWARQLQKGTMTANDIPTDIRDEVIELAKTLPLRDDMVAAKAAAQQETPVTE